MYARSHRLSALLVAAAAVFTAPVGAQQFQAFGRAATVTVGGRFHYQYALSSVASANNDFFVKRARPNLDLAISDFLAARVETEFAGGSVLRDAWVRLDFSDAFMLSTGQFKRAFDAFFLASSVDLSLIERDGRVEGLDACTGVGSVCTYGRFMEELDYADRDMGVRVEGASGQISYNVTFTNGTGYNTADENDAKSMSGRLVFAATSNVRVAGSIAAHDYENPNGTERAMAFGGDVEVGTWRDGLHFQGAVVSGDNWLQLDGNLDPVPLLAGQAAISYYYPMDGMRLVGIEPLARVSYADPDTGSDDDGAFLFTPGLMFYVNGRTKIGANLDIYSPQTGDMETSFKVQTFLYY